jgi:UDP:flavonoid glycosyltransferase YjiC (YdhE family)
MRVVFTVYPSLAHLYPIVPCAWALQSAGHEVRIASHGRFADSIAAVGLTPVRLGDADSHEARTRDDAKPPADPEDVLRYAEVMSLDHTAREHWIIFYQVLLCSASDYVRLDLPQAGDLVDFSRVWRPDLVLWDPTMPAGAVAARVTGAAHARFLPGLDYFAYSLDLLAQHRDQLRAAGLPENPLADLVRPLAERYGVKVDEELLVGQWTVDPLPRGLSLPTSAAKVPVRWVPYTGGEVFQEWLYQRPKRPRVGLSLGESTRRFIAGDCGRTPMLFEALADLDVEAVATLNELQLDGVKRIPDNVRVIDWVPLTQLMPTCSALIHHGGNGTFSAAAAFRVPHLVCDTDESLLLRRASVDSVTGSYSLGREFGVRETSDPENPAAQWVLPAKKVEATVCADFVTAHGAGARLNHQTQSVLEIRKQIEQVVTEPSYRKGAQSVYETWLATASPADIIPQLRTLTAEHRHGTSR